MKHKKLPITDQIAELIIGQADLKSKTVMHEVRQRLATDRGFRLTCSHYSSIYPALRLWCVGLKIPSHYFQPQ